MFQIVQSSFFNLEVKKRISFPLNSPKYFLINLLLSSSQYLYKISAYSLFFVFLSLVISSNSFSKLNSFFFSFSFLSFVGDILKSLILVSFFVPRSLFFFNSFKFIENRIKSFSLFFSFSVFTSDKTIFLFFWLVLDVSTSENIFLFVRSFKFFELFKLSKSSLLLLL